MARKASAVAPVLALPEGNSVNTAPETTLPPESNELVMTSPVSPAVIAQIEAPATPDSGIPESATIKFGDLMPKEVASLLSNLAESKHEQFKGFQAKYNEAVANAGKARAVANVEGIKAKKRQAKPEERTKAQKAFMAADKQADLFDQKADALYKKMEEIYQKSIDKAKAEDDKKASEGDKKEAELMKANAIVPLTDAEMQDYEARLAEIQEAGKALRQSAMAMSRGIAYIKEHKLYKFLGYGLEGFAEWGKQVLGLEKTQLYAMADFSKGVDALATLPLNPEIAAASEEATDNYFPRYPENLRQYEFLKKAGSLDNQAAAWREVLKRVGDGPITALLISEVVNELFPKPGKSAPTTQEGDKSMRAIAAYNAEQGVPTFHLEESPLNFNKVEYEAVWRTVRFIATCTKNDTGANVWKASFQRPEDPEVIQHPGVFTGRAECFKELNGFAREYAKEQWEEDAKKESEKQVSGIPEIEDTTEGFFYVGESDGTFEVFSQETELDAAAKETLGYDSLIGPFPTLEAAEEAAEVERAKEPIEVTDEDEEKYYAETHDDGVEEDAKF